MDLILTANLRFADIQIYEILETSIIRLGTACIFLCAMQNKLQSRISERCKCRSEYILAVDIRDSFFSSERRIPSARMKNHSNSNDSARSLYSPDEISLGKMSSVSRIHDHASVCNVCTINSSSCRVEMAK